MSRIILLSNLLPSLDVSLIEQAILSIVSPIKGLNARSLQSTLSVPIVFFDSRDARSVFDYLSAHPSALNSLSNDKVVVQIISTNQLLRQFGPSPFLDSIDPSFHLRVHPPFNLSVVQNLLTSFGDLQTLTPLSQKILDSQVGLLSYSPLCHFLSFSSLFLIAVNRTTTSNTLTLEMQIAPSLN